MHKALNETLAALPDDTKVYVCCYSGILWTLLMGLAWTRVHQGECQVLYCGSTVGAY